MISNLNDFSLRLIVEENCGDADISTNVYDGEACLTSFAEACKVNSTKT